MGTRGYRYIRPVYKRVLKYSLPASTNYPLLGMASGWDWNGFTITYSYPSKKFILIPIPKSNGYQNFVSYPFSPSNRYIFVPYPYPLSYYFNIN